MVVTGLTGTRRIAVISIFSALAVATDYAMLPFSNVKLMDSIVFVSAMTFGLLVGASVGALTWLVYGSVNPLGADSPPFLGLLILSEMTYALFGYLARGRIEAEKAGVPSSLLWGALGLVSTFIYDVNTIVTPALVAGLPFVVAILTLLPAIPFLLAHELSNFVFFATVAPLLFRAIRKVSAQSAEP